MAEEITLQKPIRSAINNIVPAFRSAGFYTSIGISIGFGLVLLASEIQHSTILKQIFNENHVDIAYLLTEHLGTGFIVSALAVFFYEWGAHIKHALDLSNQLKDGINQINNLMQTTDLSTRLANILDTEYKQKVSPEFEKTLESLLTEGGKSPGYLSDLTKNISSIATAVRDIRRNNSWATEQYVEFINYLLTNVVELNARTLEHVSKKQDGEYPFSVPTDGAKMADEILATHMRALTFGDSYDTVSHVTSWTRLRGFHKETFEAVKNRGVKVRRVFNFRIKYEEELKPKQIREILITHLKDIETLADENGKKRYEVKVIRQDEMDKTAPSTNFRNLFPKSHFGTFTKNIEGVGKSKIRVKVTFSNLSDMTLSSDEQLYKKEIEVFDEAWEIGTDLTLEVIDSIISQWESKDSTSKQTEKVAKNIQNDEREQLAAESNQKTGLPEPENPTEE